MKDLIQKLASTGDEFYAKICEVTKVDSDKKTADLKPLDGSAEVLDVFLVTDFDNGGLYLEPKKGALVCVVFVTKEIAVMVNPGELVKMQLEIEQTKFRVDKDGFLLKKQSESLAKLMKDLLQEIQKMKFTTNTGSTILLVNKPSFIAIENRFKQLLKED